nr:YhgE/Pip domain-containing protein [Sporolactobacillus mangiferae]
MKQKILLHWLRFIRQPSMLLIIAGLAIMPSAYAWINIKAMWDPYKNTSGLSVAVINEDAGSRIQGKSLFAGKEIVSQLRYNHQLGWQFVNRSEADRRLKEGTCYASIRIPRDFSARISSILKDRPVRPTIDYTVNEKINSVTPKIAGSGANELVTQISNTFVKQVSQALFQGFHKAGIAFKQELPLFNKAKSDLLNLEQLLPEFHHLGAESIELEQRLDQLKQKTGKIKAFLQQIEDIRQSAEELSQLNTQSSKIRETLNAISLYNDYMDTVRAIPSVLDRTQSSINKIENSVSALSTTSEARQTNARRDLIESRNQLHAISNDLDQLNQEAKRNADELSNVLTRSNQSSDQILSDAWPQAMHSGAQFFQKNLSPAIDRVHQSGSLFQEHLAKIERTIHQAAQFSKNDLPVFERSVRIAADKIRQFDSQVNLNEIIHMLTLDPESHSDFLASPIAMKTTHLFPIPNYGTAMAPFYTLLSLWVGATLMISVLPIKPILPFHSAALSVHFGQLAKFTALGLVQTSIVTAGDLLFLKIYALHPWLFFWCCLFCSMIFVCITYTLCALLGTIGKGLSVILLVLQISASGGTFPVSMTPAFFQNISTYLPFTYAIGLIRETIGGVVPTVAVRNLSALFLFFIAFILLGGLFCATTVKTAINGTT